MHSDLQVDLMIVGCSTGGFAATLAALEAGVSVCWVSNFPWIGGQLTSQAVPPDEHRYIESFGSSKRYRSYRKMVRTYYRKYYPLNEEAKKNTHLNPGGGSVSRLCHEPKVSVQVLESLIAPYISLGQLIMLREHRLVSVERSGAKIKQVTVAPKKSPRLLGQTEAVTVEAAYFIDSTEMGDLLAYSKTPFVTGTEARSETHEWHAAQTADPTNVQAITWCFAMSRDGAEGSFKHVQGPEPQGDYRDIVWPDTETPLFSWSYVHPIKLELIDGGIEKGKSAVDLWLYRKLLTADHYDDVDLSQEITLVNWPQNDQWVVGPIPREGSPLELWNKAYERATMTALDLSAAWFKWLREEAPRSDGGKGYPELRLRPDVTGTVDGFAQAPYIREGRRLQGMETISEQHMGYAMQLYLALKEGRVKEQAIFDLQHKLQLETGTDEEHLLKFLYPHAIEGFTPKPVPNAIAVGYYRIDLHPSTGGVGYVDLPAVPFQIPLGAILSPKTANLLAGGKTLASTHISNGAARVHPAEWCTGEAAGSLAAFCVKEQLEPWDVYDSPEHTKRFQAYLKDQGVDISWPDDIFLEDW